MDLSNQKAEGVSHHAPNDIGGNFLEYLQNFLSLLPLCIFYLISGFGFLWVFSFVRLDKWEKDIQHVILASLFAGFVVCNVVDFILLLFHNMIEGFFGTVELSIPQTFVNLLYVAAGAGGGYLCGKLYTGDFSRKLLDKLNVQRTTASYLWNDLLDASDPPRGFWIYLEFPDIHRAYYGSADLIEGHERFPIIVLARYTEYAWSEASGQYNVVLKEYDQDPTQKVVLDSSKAGVIKLVYDSESANIQNVKQGIEGSRQGNG